MRASLLVSPIVAALLLAGCSSDTSLPFESGASAPPNAVAFNTSVIRTAVGDTARLHVIRSRGASASTEAIRWRVANPEVAGLEDGLVFPLSEGATEITASVDGGTATVSVIAWGPTQVNGLSISPSPLQLDAGATAQLDAELSYSNGLRVKLRTSPTWKTLNTGIATVVNGKVTGISAGSAKVVATMGVASDTITVTVATPMSEPAPASPRPTIAELPRVYLSTEMPVVTGRTIRVAAGTNLQTALDAAQPGDELVLDAGATFTGSFVLRKKAGTDWIIIRSSGPLPSAGTRVTPAAAAGMARIVAPNPASPAISTEAGAHHYRLIGLEVTANAGATFGYTMIALGDGSSAQNTLAKVPSALVLDRMYIHGTPTLSFQRCIGMNSASTAVIDSYISECHGKGFDSQAIGGWNGPGPYKIVNNYLEAAGENVLFGGADPHISGLTPSDMEIRRNHLFKPMAWKDVWTVKNLFELKHGQRVLLEGNVLENNWVSGQTGYAILFQALSDDNSAPWTRVMDITVRHNIIRHSAAGVNILARVAYGKNGILPDEPAQRIHFYNNLFLEIGTDPSLGMTGRLFQLLGDLQDVRLENNTGMATHSAIMFDGDGIPARGLVVVNNIFGRGYYGFFGSGMGEGLPALAKFAPDAVVSGNVIIGARSNIYPSGNYFPATAQDVGFLDLSSGNLRLGGNSPYKRGARRQRQAGADVDAVVAATAGVATVAVIP